VVGGGPAGLMTAEVLATHGVAVTVYEHMRSVGRKFLLAGRSGLNITHSEPLDQLLTRFDPADERLVAAVRSWGPEQLQRWSASLGQPTFEGSSGRVFPEAFRATPLLRAWLRRLDALGVEIRTEQRWLGWATTDQGSADPRTSMFAPRPRPGQTQPSPTEPVASDVTVLALGGASWPRVGSDGAWVAPVRTAGVVVHELQPANCGVRVDWSALMLERFDGAPIKNLAVTVQGVSIRGAATITAGGLEGGPIYAHTAAIRHHLGQTGSCVLWLDLHPDLTREQIITRLSRRRPKDSVTTALRRTLGLPPEVIALLHEVVGTRLPHGPAELAHLIKSAPLEVRATMPIERAISTAGGVGFTELDEAFMLRSLPGNFVAGEMLDWEAPTGGYLLQGSFSTAVAAAHGALHWLAWP
jgi:uncharacterized flavoprotein (TIGR03862 family)